MMEQFVKINGERFIVDMMYARKDNMTGQAVYQDIGWGNLAVVHVDLWRRLQQLIPTLRKRRMKLKICDAYRPPEAHEIMKTLLPMPGFFAPTPEQSQHCRGTAVDVCLCDEDGHEFSYPTKVDAYEEEYCRQALCGETELFMAHLQKARHDYYEAGIAMEVANRDFLRQLMDSVKLEAIPHEWWHFNLPDGKTDSYLPVQLNAADYR